MKIKRLLVLFPIFSIFSFVSCKSNSISLESNTLKIKNIDTTSNLSIQLEINSREKVTFPKYLEEVKIDNSIVDKTNYKYDYKSGLLVFSKEYINKKINIKAEASFYYDVNLVSKSLKINESIAFKDEDLNISLLYKTPSYSKEFPPSLSSMKIGDKTLSKDEYTYDSNKGTIVVNKNLIINDIYITAEEFDKKDYSYVSIFNADSHAKVYVYDSQDYSKDPIKSNYAYSKDGDTGEYKKDGNGQVNFKVVLDEGYDVDFIWVKGLYKDLKNKDDTKIDDVYRITKIRGDLEVKIATKKINIKNVKYHLEDGNKFIFSWDIRENNLIENFEIKIEHDKFSEPIIETSNTNSYTFIDNDVSDDKPYKFSFTPIYKNGDRGETTKLSKMINSDDLSSPFPRLVINTMNYQEPVFHRLSEKKYATDSDYIKSNLKIYKDNNLVYQSGSNFKGSKVKIRGNYTSIYYDKKPYKIKLTESADLLESFYEHQNSINYKNKEWVLLDLNFTRNIESDLNSEIFRTPIGFKLAELMDFEWKPRYKIFQLYMNDDYKGLYVLCECTSIGEGTGENQSRYKLDTDGYIIEKDIYYDFEDISFKTLIIGEEEMSYSFKYPDNENFNETSYTYSYIKNLVNSFEKKLKTFSSYEVLEKFVDMNTFARWLLAHDILSNHDGRGSNIFLYKKNASDDSKLKMGTIWDFDSTLREAKSYSIQRSCPESYFQYLRWYNEFNKLVRSMFDNLKNDICVEINNFMENEFDNDVYNNLLKTESNKYEFKNIITIENQKKKVNDFFNNQITWLDKKL